MALSNWDTWAMNEDGCPVSGVFKSKLEYKFFEQAPKEDEIDCFDSCKMHEKINALERKIDLIFGGHVLIDGIFKKV